jgi:ribosomal protein L11 methyltransferase
MNYLKLRLDTPEETMNEILIAHLCDYEFNGFYEEEDKLVAYIAEENYTSALDLHLEDLKKQYNFQITKTTIVDQNWNAKWESDYEPVLVDDFCAVRATFHQPITVVKHEIVVTPKMSFGTGHHATTYMVMKQMEQHDFVDKTVFDYGCGTAVLAILAIKLGASTIDAIDIDKWAYENSIENVEINNCAESVNIFCGEIDIAPTKEYDFVFANINRNVILNTMEGMASRLKKGGYLLTSGFLEADIDLVTGAAAKFGLILETKMAREQWRCLLMVKK